jgi:hypothetical protein
VPPVLARRRASIEWLRQMGVPARRHLNLALIDQEQKLALTGLAGLPTRPHWGDGTAQKGTAMGRVLGRGIRQLCGDGFLMSGRTWT